MNLLISPEPPKSTGRYTALTCLVASQISTGPDKHKPKGEDGKPLPLLEEGSEATAEGDLLVLAVGNGKRAGGSIPLCPDAGVQHRGGPRWAGGSEGRV